MTTTRNLAQSITRMVAGEVRRLFGTQYAMDVLFHQLEDDFKEALKPDTTIPTAMTHGHMMQRWHEQRNMTATSIRNNIMSEIVELVDEELNDGGLER